MKTKQFLVLLIFCCCVTPVFSQSVARDWNELILEAIRKDKARPTVHARNLFHISAAMYDAWASYETGVSTYFLGKDHRGYYVPFEGAQIPQGMSKKDAQEIAISFAAHRLLTHRFRDSPGFRDLKFRFDTQLEHSFQDTENYSTANYQTDPVELGNYIAEEIIAFGLSDGSNEANDYACRFYQPVNTAMYPDAYGSNHITDPNRWQPLSFEDFVGQSGISEGASTPKFVGAEWGQVVPFSLTKDQLTIKRRNGHDYLVYFDPSEPAYIHLSPEKEEKQDYQWGFGLVAQWSSHHDTQDDTLWDISPNSIGNIPFDELPRSVKDYPSFYDFENGGDISQGYTLNPITGLPYEPQWVRRSDYTRVLAEFWADGPDSETPPGHWFVLLNYINDHPAFERKYKGQGEKMDALEWNVKSYMALGGAMHDAAIAAWGIKGYYDYIRPVSAIRSMAERGQSSDSSLPNYHPAGLPLIPGQVEIIQADDPINEYQNFENQLKIKAWKIPNRYYEGSLESKNVDWILATRWQPYQRPSFVTPPFAGYVSGHSTFSRTAAELFGLLTGSEYFPGGMGEFHAEKNKFLVFETGPSEDVTLQWAKYQDASDQCSLSRIWGGIHPPVDDIAGRLIGYQIGHHAFETVEKYFNGEVQNSEPSNLTARLLYGPNPVSTTTPEITITFRHPDDLEKTIAMYDLQGNEVMKQKEGYVQNVTLDTQGLRKGVYLVMISTKEYSEKIKLVVAP
ncbi:T9SS type A sorting domain-containing protein [Reichenbachiella agarivorans]|uniref:T9SS type A sorting domain-containing protein n=1 Tax=Reichenbachiella agarivorans TaxID=2979464 RepID=A0ABY6CQZ9_9BACT|nr:T9SS type A sorting domain-containing protein [Reichenbachiella agarivorans]UXP32928.1 T9SS type A sorting domain-containing protein [Reichenbachiella agarivorans]